jgi:hypothetical protein
VETDAARPFGEGAHRDNDEALLRVRAVRFPPGTVLVVLLLVSGCEGLISVKNSTPAAPVDGPTDVPPAEPPPATWDIPALPATCAPTRAPGVRLLTNAEVDATLEATFSLPSPVGAALPPEVLASGYATNAEREVSALYVDAVDAQSALYAAAVAPQVQAGLSCGASEAEAACVRRQLGALGAALWRRPLDTTELDEVMDVFTVGRAGATLQDGLTLALQALLGAPSFLYRRELGVPAGDHLVLSPDELAEALAYDFTGGPPDEALKAKAAAGELADGAAREAEAQRLLETPAGREHLAAFTTQWLELSSLPQVTRDTARFPSFSIALRDSMVEETRRFTQAVFYGPAPTAKALWNSQTTFVDDRLAAFYGLEARPGADFVQVDTGATTRRGLLGQAGLLLSHSHADSSSPVKRGVFVLKRALCRPLPPPPPNVMFSLGSPDEPRTTRERYAQHSSDPSCAGCHRLIDPPGFALEGFDAIGQARTEEHGYPLDLTGELIAGGASGPLTGSEDLAQQVGDSQEAADCLVQNLATFTLGRVAGEPEACLVQTARHRSLTRGGDAMEALRALAGSDAYVTRRAP